MKFLNKKKIQIKEKNSNENINFFSEINANEYYSITSNSNSDIEIVKNLEDIFPFNQEFNITEDINENDIYFNNNINNKEKNVIEFNNINQKTINSSQKLNQDNLLNKKRRRGRKKIGSGEEGTHNKMTFDNLLRKIKTSLLKSFRDLLNDIIKKVYNYNKLPSDLELIKVNQDQARNSNIEFNRIFIHKTLKEIFSEETTIKNHCEREHNKILIEHLLDEKNEEKRKNFEILNLTFLDLMKYAIGERQDLTELQGLKLPKKLLNEMSSKEEYSKLIVDILKNIEDILQKKLPRKRQGKKCLEFNQILFKI